ncbi:MAG: hypothetical protein ACI9YE_000938, partial [Psychroserpens sp.]
VFQRIRDIIIKEATIIIHRVILRFMVNAINL